MITLIPFAQASASAVDRYHNSVLLSRDVKLIQEYRKQRYVADLNSFAAKHKLHVTTTKEDMIILVDQRTYRGKASNSVQSIVDFMNSPRDSDVISVATLSKDQQSACVDLLRRSPLPPGMVDKLSAAKDLKLQVQPWMKMMLKVGDRSMTVNFGLSPDGDADSMATGSLATKAAMAAAPATRRTEAELAEDGEADLMFTFSPSANLPLRSQLMERASEVFKRLSEIETERLRSLGRDIAMSGLDRSWDGFSPTDVSALSPAVRRRLEQGFVGIGENFGFQSEAAARNWFQRATIVQSEPSAMIWVGTAGTDGILKSGFGLNTIRN